MEYSNNRALCSHTGRRTPTTATAQMNCTDMTHWADEARSTNKYVLYDFENIKFKKGKKTKLEYLGLLVYIVKLWKKTQAISNKNQSGDSVGEEGGCLAGRAGETRGPKGDFWVLSEFCLLTQEVGSWCLSCESYVSLFMHSVVHALYSTV